MSGSKYLILLSQNSPAVYRIDDRPGMTFGRRTQKNNPDIGVKDAFVSRSHGRFIRDNSGRFFYEDMGSGNGSWLDGNKLVPGNRVELQNGSVIEIKGGAHGSASQMVYIWFVDGEVHDGWAACPLNGRTPLMMGRSKSNDICFPSEYISRKHAGITFRNGSYILEDCGSLSGTKVNGAALTAPVPLKDGSMIRLADYTALFAGNTLYYNSTQTPQQGYTAAPMQGAVHPQAMQMPRPGVQPQPSPQAMVQAMPQSAGPGRDILRANIVTKRVPSNTGRGEKELIRDVRLSVKEGALVALLGSSGAGKTTVMNCLNGMDLQGVRGQVMFYDDDLIKNFDRLKFMIGSVPQREVFHEMLTVEEELREAAVIRLPKRTSRKEIKMHVDRAIRQLGLENVRKNQLSKCSGGEKRRVNIAIELVAERQLLCLDEPDAGLDPGMKRELFTILRNLAHNEKKSILVIIHDVSEMQLFDQIVIMAKFHDVGRLAFSGSPADAEKYFGCPLKDVYQLLTEHPERYIR